MKKRYASVRTAVLALAIALSLAACGGGGGSDSTAVAATDSTTPSSPVESGVLTVACEGCGASDSSTYAGSGVGVWEKANRSGADEDVPVAVSGLTGQDVTLIITNETDADVAFPAIRTLSSQTVQRKSTAPRTASAATAISEFNRIGWARLANSEGAASGPALKSMTLRAVVYNKGDLRTFYNELDNTKRATQLQEQVATSDGTTVNFWVEVGEFGGAKVTAAQLLRMATTFASAGGIYDMLRQVGGPLWGAHKYGNLIGADVKTVDVVLLNFVNDKAAYGTVGYFWAGNNFTQAGIPDSNESLALFLDSETTYLDGEDGFREVVSALAHEGLHMSNYYRRSVLKGSTYGFDTWLEELTAIVMEDVAASRIDPTFNPVRDSRLADYLRLSSYNCTLTTFTPYGEFCESYAVTGTFGGFLVRQLGVAFFKDLLNRDESDSEAVLQAAIANAGSSLQDQLRRFAVSAIGVVPADAAPAGFGFPARNEGGFALPGIDAHAQAARRMLPSASPATLRAYGSFPVVRKGVHGTFTETVRIPTGSVLSVVIH